MKFKVFNLKMLTSFSIYYLNFFIVRVTISKIIKRSKILIKLVKKINIDINNLIHNKIFIKIKFILETCE